MITPTQKSEELNKLIDIKNTSSDKRTVTYKIRKQVSQSHL